MFETMLHESILKMLGGDLEHSIRSRCIEPGSTKDYINVGEAIDIRTKIGRNWYKALMGNKASGKPISIPNKPQDRASFKCHKCGSTSHLFNTCLKKTRIIEIKIEKAEDTKEKTNVSEHESDSETSEEIQQPDQLSIQKMNIYLEFIEVHTHLQQYSD
ncbi:hypothetical protein O181_102751 [Austropuccinia psidii MF-1]|uniref:Uncharacterized protein n=1 Tax=Austropuccinia psidii MF-1 TaxID=1389203 RepID=A0A9Q3JJB1_9BASI|nr:hypothetical protein [Austropuccinia psidii MF-1]